MRRVATEGERMVRPLVAAKVVAYVALPFAEQRRVDGEHDGAVAAGLHPFDQSLGLFARVVVALKPERTRCYLRDLLHAATRIGAERHNGASCADRLGRRAFA